SERAGRVEQPTPASGEQRRSALVAPVVVESAQVELAYRRAHVQFGQLAGHGLRRQRLVAGRGVDDDVEAIGVPGVAQQRLGPRHIVRVWLNTVVIAERYR